MMWNLAAAVAHLQASAEPEPVGLCAQYTRQAIEAGGLTLTQHVSAKDYGSSLTAVGFTAIHEENRPPPQVNDSTYAAAKKGDVVVMSDFTDPTPPAGYAAYHGHGHMQMYDGTQWISDFRQRTFYPGPPYRRAAPNYVVYRFAVTAPEPAEPPIYSLLPESPFSWLPDFGSTPADPTTGPTATPSQAEANMYRVKSGDSLGLIALNFWGDALLWPLIHDDNYATIGANANSVSPGTELRIRDIAGLSDSERAATRQRGRSW